MSRPVRRLLVVGSIIVGISLCVVYLTRPRPIEVAVVSVERGRVEATVTNTRAGTVKAIRRAKIAPSSSGQVTRLEVKEGDRVEEGAVLLELWNKDLRARLHLAQSELAAQEALHEETCRNLEYYDREVTRQEQLSEQGYESEGSLDAAKTRAEAGRSACAAAEAQVSVATDRVTLVEAELERTVLTAPFAGVVAEVNCELGEVVAPSPPGIPTPPAVELIDPSDPFVSAPIDEVDAPAIRLGMPARIRLDAMPDHPFPGTVRRIAPYVVDVEKQARTVEVEVSFADAEVPGLLPGYSADAEILLDAKENTLRIPTQAILEGDRVLVYVDGEPLEERRIRRGVRSWEFTEVLEGLAQGDLIVVSVQREGVGPGVHAKADRVRSPGVPAAAADGSEP